VQSVGQHFLTRSEKEEIFHLFDSNAIIDSHNRLLFSGEVYASTLCSIVLLRRCQCCSSWRKPAETKCNGAGWSTFFATSLSASMHLLRMAPWLYPMLVQLLYVMVPTSPLSLITVRSWLRKGEGDIFFGAHCKSPARMCKAAYVPHA
jgi:hypothetical protein